MKIEEEMRERREIAFRHELANEGIICGRIRQQRLEGDDPRLIDFGAPDSFVAVAEMKAHVPKKRRVITGSTCLH